MSTVTFFAWSLLVAGVVALLLFAIGAYRYAINLGTAASWRP